MNNHISTNRRDDYYELLAHLGRFVMWRERLTAREFFSLYEAEVAEFIRKFHPLYESDLAGRRGQFSAHSSVPVYRKIARDFYREVWKERLTRKVHLKAVDELLDLKRSFGTFLELLRDAPALTTIVGGQHIARVRSRSKEIDARIFHISKQTDKAIRSLEQAAYELAWVPAPSALDLGHAARLNARAEEIGGYKELRKRLPDYGKARESFRRAARNAKRCERILSGAGDLNYSRSIARHFVWRLRYWQHVASAASFSLEGRFAEAGRRVPVMTVYATRLPGLPKWFVGPKDVSNHALVIRAYEALVTRRDLAGARALLDEWMGRSEDISATGRYMRLKVRKLAVDVLCLWPESRQAARQTTQDLMRLLESRRSFGRGELYIRSVLQALLEGHVDYDAALERVSSVFVLEATAPKEWGGYFDQRTEEEKHFRFLPAFFYEWLVEAGTEELTADELLYILLLYVRCVVEFWCSVHVKRLAVGKITVPLSRKPPKNFARTDWAELLALLEELASAFYTEPALRLLCEMLQNSRALLPASGEGRPTDLEQLRSFIVDVICKTERYAFPEPVYLDSQSATAEGGAQVRLRRTRRALRHFNISFMPRRGQQLLEGGCYFMKPGFKRSEKETSVEELVLYPLRPASCYGEPGSEWVALLVEGAYDFTVFEKVLSRFNPHWGARIQIFNAGGVQRFSLRTRDLADVFKHVIVVGDAVRAERELVDTRRVNRDLVFELNPDLEGADAAALRLTMAELAPDLSFTAGEIEEVIAEARLKKEATVKCLRNYQSRRDGPPHKIFYDMNGLKKMLAEPLGRKMVEVGPSEQVVAPVAAALRLGFGHP
jgi:hypothetical protein